MDQVKALEILCLQGENMSEYTWNKFRLFHFHVLRIITSMFMWLEVLLKMCLNSLPLSVSCSQMYK